MISKTLTAVFLVAAIAHADDIQQTTVFKGGEGAYKVYRIPAAIMTTKGTLLAFAEGRQAKGDSGEIHLIVRRSADNGATFGETSVVWSDGANTCGNPCPVVDRSTGTIWLLMTHNPGNTHEKEITPAKARGTRTVWVTSSIDDGVTWSKPREITNSVKKPEWTWYATGPGIGIQLERGEHKGRLVIPCDHVIKGGGPNSGNSHVIYSDDHGETWKLGGSAPKNEFNESQVAELSDGRVMLNMRNHAPAIEAGAPKHRGVAISFDGGETFTELRRDATLIEPICQASILRIADKLLFANPASTEKRMNMTVRMSTDDGQTWPTSKVIHSGPAAYSCLVALPDGAVGLLYECGEKQANERIDFARFKLD